MLPEGFLTRIKAQLGEEYAAFLASLERPRAVAMRFNPLKTDFEDLAFVQGNVPWEPMGYYYDPESRPGLHPFHEAGVYYLQEASAMAPVALLDPKPGEFVADLCAAPGGKSTQIAGRLGGEGFLLCNEWSPKRAKILSRNIERLGVGNALVTNEEVSRLAQRYEGFFHKVLIDAPCSGEGMFRKEEAAVTDWSEETVAMCAGRQKEILRSAAQMLAPGGRLVYSTCTFAPAENEGAMAAFLKEFPEFSVVQEQGPWFDAGRPEWVNGPEALRDTFRLWPHKLRGEGHYAAVLEKAGGAPEADYTAKTKAPEKEFANFCRENLVEYPEGKFLSFGETLFVVPQATPELKGLKVLRAGLELGEMKKNRFEPAHAWALWLKTAKNVLDLKEDGEEVRKYLRGETLAGPQNGWTLVTVDGLSLGWAKGSGGVLKNHFPKALRWMG